MNQIQWLRFLPLAQFLEHGLVDPILRVDKALQVEADLHHPMTTICHTGHIVCKFRKLVLRDSMTTISEPETSTTPESAPEAPKSAAPRLLSRISIQSKLLVMLLVTSILSAAVVGAIGYQSGRSSLRASVFDRLTEIRGSQSRQLEAKFADLQDSLVIYTRGRSTAPRPSRRSPPAFDQLNNATITPAQWQSIVDYYKQSIREGRGRSRPATAVDVDALLPTSNAQRYLQAYYTAPFTDWDKAIRFDDARDGSAWSAANARFNDFFREIVHALRVRGRPAARHPGQRRLQRL